MQTENATNTNKNKYVTKVSKDININRGELSDDAKASLGYFK